MYINTSYMHNYFSKSFKLRALLAFGFLWDTLYKCNLLIFEININWLLHVYFVQFFSMKRILHLHRRCRPNFLFLNMFLFPFLRISLSLRLCSHYSVNLINQVERDTVSILTILFPINSIPINSISMSTWNERTM